MLLGVSRNLQRSSAIRAELKRSSLQRSISSLANKVPVDRLKLPINNAFLNTLSDGSSINNVLNVSELTTSSEAISSSSEPHRPVSSTLSRMHHYTAIHPKIDASPSLSIQSFRSEQTGLSVSVVQTEGPIVRIKIVVPTEVRCTDGCGESHGESKDTDNPSCNNKDGLTSIDCIDSGLPHTLEHLIFLGSKRLPFKGALDKLANRALGDGTNAWTDKDCTVYTFSCASVDGALALLPVYLDHVFNPTMTESAFVTEVHHINGQGEDGGVVFCEIQGYENMQEEISSLALARSLYGRSSGYRAETGGLTGPFSRLTNSLIRKYHQENYASNRCRVIVSGNVSVDSVLETLGTNVDPILCDDSTTSLFSQKQNRPWLDTPSAIPTVIHPNTPSLQVRFPSSDPDATGLVSYTVIGPLPTSTEVVAAIDILLEYFSATAISPLQSRMVEISNPLCTDITASQTARSSGNELTFDFSAVNIQMLDSIAPEIKAIFSEHILDFDRIRVLVDRNAVSIQENIEGGAEDFADSCILQDHLYGTMDGTTLTQSLLFREMTAKLLTYTLEDWNTLIKTYFIQNPGLIVVARPSAELADRIQDDAKIRIQENTRVLGESGLAQKAEVLCNAQKVNNSPVPEHILEDFKIPSLDTIRWIDVSLSEDVESNISTHFIQTQTDFVDIRVSMVLSALSDEQLSIVPFFAEAIQSLPVKQFDGKLLSRDQVTAQLDIDTLTYDCFRLGEFTDVLDLTIRVKMQNAEKGLNWAHDLLFNADFSDTPLLSVALNKMSQNLPDRRLEGDVMAGATKNHILFRGATSLAGLIGQSSFIPMLQEKFSKDPSILGTMLTSFRKACMRTVLEASNLRLIISGDIEKLSDVKLQARKIFGSVGSRSALPAPWPKHYLTEIGNQLSTKAFIVPLSSCDSSFAIYSARGLEGGYMDHDLPALHLACEWLNSLEGHLYRATRGAGLAYGATLKSFPASGLCEFVLYRSADALQAWSIASQICHQIASGTIEISQNEIESTVSTLAFKTASNSSSPNEACEVLYRNSMLKRVSESYDQDLIKSYANVTKRDVVNVIIKYILPIFDPKSSIAVIVTNPGKVEKLTASLKQTGYDVEIQDMSFGDLDSDSDDTQSEMAK